MVIYGVNLLAWIVGTFSLLFAVGVCWGIGHYYYITDPTTIAKRKAALEALTKADPRAVGRRLPPRIVFDPGPAIIALKHNGKRAHGRP